MNNKYIDLIDQSFDFPQPEFKLEDKNLQFHDIDLMKLVEQYGAPLITFNGLKNGLLMHLRSTITKANTITAIVLKVRILSMC